MSSGITKDKDLKLPPLSNENRIKNSKDKYSETLSLKKRGSLPSISEGHQTPRHVEDDQTEKAHGNSSVAKKKKSDAKVDKNSKFRNSAKITLSQNPQNTGEVGYKYDGDITQCLLCKNTLDFPKQLSCLHSFCKQCVENYFIDIRNYTKSVRIRCPICNDYQHGKRASGSAPEVIDLLPTSYYLQNSIATENMRICRPCSRENKSTEAVIWCYHCAESLCSDHGDYHNDITLRDVHRVCDINDVSNDNNVAYLPGFCCLHPTLTLNYFCRDHRSPSCENCKKSLHRNCDNVVTIENEAEEYKKSTNELFEKLIDLEKQCVNVLEDIRKNETDINNCRKKDEVAISEMRQKLNSHIDSLQSKLTNDLLTRKKEKESEIQLEVTLFEKRHETLSFYRKLLAHLLDEGVGVQVFFELPNIYQQSNIVAEKLHHQSIVFQDCKLYVRLNEDVLEIESLGKIVEMQVNVEVSEPYIPTSRKLRDGLSPRQVALQSSFRQAFLVIRFQSSLITGGTSIDGALVLADYVCKEIRAYNDNGNRNSLNIRHLNGNPWDLVEISDYPKGCILVISFPQQNKLMLLQWENNMAVFQEYHKTKDKCYSVEKADDTVVVACLRHIEIWHVYDDLSMKRKSVIPVTGEKVENVLPADLSRLYYTDSTDNGAFYCISKDGSLLFQYEHPELKCPCGIANDRAGLIYVTGYKSNNIHNLTSEGELLRVIVPQVSSFYRPRVLVENSDAVFVVFGRHKVFEIS